MAEHPNAALIRRLSDALASGDLQGIEEVLAEDAFVHDPGRGVVAGDYLGKEQAADFFAELLEQTAGTYKAEVIDVLANDQRAVLIQRSTARRQHRSLDTRDVLVAEIHDGRIRSIQIYSADEDAENAFWAKVGSPPTRHSELSDAQLDQLGEVLRELGKAKPFSGSEALVAALDAGVVNGAADIGSAIDDLEDAGVLREVTRNPPRWRAADAVD